MNLAQKLVGEKIPSSQPKGQVKFAPKPPNVAVEPQPHRTYSKVSAGKK